jgi:hypothetical protein
VQTLDPVPSNQRVRSHWYGRGLGRDDGSAAVYFDGIAGARGTVMLVLRGGFFERLGQLPPDELRALCAGFECRRVDLAADLYDADGLSPADLYARLPAARLRSRPANQQLQMNRAGGQTLTLGARVSALYVRIYVKADPERVRHEVECKDDLAPVVWGRLLAGDDPAVVWADVYGRAVLWR